MAHTEQKIDSKRLDLQSSMTYFKDCKSQPSWDEKQPHEDSSSSCSSLKKSPSKKRVKFPPLNAKDQIIEYDNNADHCDNDDGEKDNDASSLWYSTDEVEAFRVQVRLAETAVNDACGDIDIVRDIEPCVQVITRRQKEPGISAEELAEISETMSSNSASLARLYALVLEKDIQENNAVSYDVLLGIVNGVLYNDDEDDDDGGGDDNNKDDASFGTIEDISSMLDGIRERSDSNAKHQPDGDEKQDGSISKKPSSRPAGDPNSKKAAKPASAENKQQQQQQRDETEQSPSTDETSALEQQQQRGTKRSLESDENKDGNVFLQVAPADAGRNVRRKVPNAMKETRDRCNVAHALISLARWEFRAHSILPKTYKPVASLNKNR